MNNSHDVACERASHMWSDFIFVRLTALIKVGNTFIGNMSDSFVVGSSGFDEGHLEGVAFLVVVN